MLRKPKFGEPMEVASGQALPRAEYQNLCATQQHRLVHALLCSKSVVGTDIPLCVIAPSIAVPLTRCTSHNKIEYECDALRLRSEAEGRDP
jgi:hypothetical protein